MNVLCTIRFVFCCLLLLQIDCPAQNSGILVKQLNPPGMALELTCMATDKANGYLLAGDYFLPSANGFHSKTTCLIRLDEDGCVSWSKRMSLGELEVIQSIISTSDTGFLISAFPFQSQTSNYPVALIVFKLDKHGNLEWANDYHSGTSVTNYLSALCETDDQGFVLEIGSFPNDGNASFLSIVKIDRRGNVAWGRKLSMGNNATYNKGGVLEKNGTIYATGSIYESVAPFQLLRSFITQLDPHTGQPNWTRQNDPGQAALTFTDVHSYRNGLLINSYTGNSSNDLLYVDPDGNPIASNIIVNPYGSLNGRGNILVTPDNSLYFHQSSGTSTGVGHKELIMRLDSNRQILWQHDFYSQDPRFSSWDQISPAPARGMAALGNGISASGLAAGGFLKVDTTGAACSSGASALSVSSATTLLVPMYWDMNTAFSPDVTSITQDLEPLAIESRLFCPGFVTACDTMRLEGPGVLCRLQDTARYILYTDHSCADPITWTYDPLNISVLSEGPSSLAVNFKKAGAYTIKVKKEGCNVVEDSIVVTAGNNPSNVYLPKDTVLCAGTRLVLDPGNGYAGYLWQDGSDRQSLMVSTPGVYWVRLTGTNGCVRTDTVLVGAIAPLPAHFLPGDTVICSYASLLIQPLQSYKSYLWNTGETTPSIQVHYAGVYTLQVEDTNGCQGGDTIRVDARNCPYGVYFPNAFTPKKGGANDRFKPVVIGYPVVYHFSIYNRSGQRIFDTGDSQKGWDGTLSGIDQASGGYVWSCLYQFHGEKANQVSGNFVLIR